MYCLYTSVEEYTILSNLVFLVYDQAFLLYFEQTYGRVPNYLMRMKLDKEAEQRCWEEEQKEMVRQRELMKLQDEERQTILEVIFKLGKLYYGSDCGGATRKKRKA